MHLTVRNVKKEYGKKAALNGFSYTFKEGIYGLLGPNGAGKSTLMKTITQNVKPTSGEILFDNNNIFVMGDKYRALIGYMPQQQNIYPFYTGRQFLSYMGILKGEKKKELNDRINMLANQVDLRNVIDDRIGTYSGGMKQRLLIAQTFLGKSKILIFDEPTAGLDPKERVHVRQLIHENSSDKIIIIATHVVQDIESIADYIILQKDGRVEKSASPDELVMALGNDREYGLEDVYMDVFGEK